MASSIDKEPNKVRPVIRKTPKRGNFWEVTFTKINPILSSWNLSKDNFATDTGKEKVEVTADPAVRSVNLSRKDFRTCDFNHFTLDDSSFGDCTFDNCRFIKADFSNVKFSNCRFVTCHFLYVTFQNCQFLDCTFSNISASAETVLFEDSSIPASTFVEALVTNVNALPEGKSEEYQLYRHVGTKAKIARAIFISVRDEPELDQMFDANRCFEIARRQKSIEESRWKEANGRITGRGFFYRLTVGGFRKAALWSIETAGFLTDWGRSPLRSVWILIGAVVMFTLLYHFLFADRLADAALRSLDCSLVFGYTKYPSLRQNGLLNFLTFVNALIGLYWYALFVPALSKRLFR